MQQVCLAELHRLGIPVLGQRGKVRKLEADLRDASFALQLILLRTGSSASYARRAPDITGDAVAWNARTPIPEDTFAMAPRHSQSAHLLQEEMVAWQKRRGAACRLIDAEF